MFFFNSRLEDIKTMSIPPWSYRHYLMTTALRSDSSIIVPAYIDRSVDFHRGILDAVIHELVNLCDSRNGQILRDIIKRVRAYSDSLPERIGHLIKKLSPEASTKGLFVSYNLTANFKEHQKVRDKIKTLSTPLEIIPLSLHPIKVAV